MRSPLGKTQGDSKWSQEIPVIFPPSHISMNLLMFPHVSQGCSDQDVLWVLSADTEGVQGA